MTIKDYQEKIHSATTKYTYETYKPLFIDYKTFLEARLEDNPKNVQAINQLAIIKYELVSNEDNSIMLLKNFLTSNAQDIAVEDKHLLLSNIGYFTIEESGLYEEGYQMYQSLVADKTTLYPPYHVLGSRYLGLQNPTEVNYPKALQYYEKASTLTTNKKVHFNYAVSLFYNNQFSKAKLVFETFTNDKNPYLKYVSRLYLTKIVGTPEAILTTFSVSAYELYEEYVDSIEIGNLLYNLDDFTNSILYYNLEIEGTVLDISWLPQYYYALKKVGDLTLLMKIQEQYINSQEEDILYNTENKDDDITVEEQQTDIIQKQLELANMNEIYNKILNSDYKPVIKETIKAEYFCYYIGCPRHLQND